MQIHLKLSANLIIRGGYTVDILILTGKFGMGHWSASLSLQEQLEADGHNVALRDFFDYALPELAPSMYRGFRFLVTCMGGVYNLYHRMTRNTSGEILLAGLLERRLGELLEEERPELILSTHPVCSGVISGYKEHTGNGIPLITCLTDVTSHSEWLHSGTDFYLVPSPDVRQALADKGVAPERVLVSGIPVRDRFGSIGRWQAGQRQLLIMGGGLGLMPRKDSFYEALNALEGVHTTILTGKNQRLYRRLAGRYENLEAVPFTDRVPEYMARAHLMLSKPGGITAFEAIAARLPMLAWEPFLEQERENADFLVRNGMARVAGKEEEACLAAIRETIYDEKQLQSMERAMERLTALLSQNAACAAVDMIAREAVCA